MNVLATKLNRLRRALVLWNKETLDTSLPSHRSSAIGCRSLRRSFSRNKATRRPLLTISGRWHSFSDRLALKKSSSNRRRIWPRFRTAIATPSFFTI